MPILYNKDRKNGLFYIPSGSLGPSVSAAFSYSDSTFSQDDTNPTPTITGTTGGTFSGTSGLVFVSTSTGEIDLSASTVAAHVVTYTVGGVSATFNLSVTAGVYVSTHSFDFDGVNDFILTGGLTIGNTFTFSLWFNHPSATPFIYLDTLFTTLNYYTVGFNGNFVFRLLNATTVNIFSADGRSNGESINGTVPTITAGTWNHVALTNDGTTAQVYFNGSPVTTTGVVTKTLDDLTNGIYIADHPTNGFITAYKGMIDEVSVWDSAISGDAITEIYNSGSPNNLATLTNASTPLSWFKMGEDATFTTSWNLPNNGTDSTGATSFNMDITDKTSNTP